MKEHQNKPTKAGRFKTMNSSQRQKPQQKQSKKQTGIKKQTPLKKWHQTKQKCHTLSSSQRTHT
ncbi:hypothetical protein, partial [Gordonia araii]|uniref:hypothetical protein n=1 Tax=Gordonia araii TaxID=263909 RepID=UPI001B8B3E7C